MDAVFTTFFMIGSSLGIGLVLFLILPTMFLYRWILKGR